MHDTLNLEQLGVPALFVASDVFADGADKQAEALGADAAAVYVPHPIQDRTDQEMVAIADEAFRAVCDELLAP